MNAVMLQRQTKGRAMQVCFTTPCRSIHRTNHIAVLSDRECGGTTMTNERDDVAATNKGESDTGMFSYNMS